MNGPVNRMHITCQNCIVRSWKSEDEKTLPRHANNIKIWRNLRDRFPHPYTPADAKEFIGRMLAKDVETNFAIDVRGEAIGGVGLMLHDDVERCSAEIGYWLSEEYWGRGIMTEALTAVVEHAFSQFELSRIYAVPFAGNAASNKVLEKAGFTLEGTLRRSAIKEGVIRDQLMYARTLD